MSTLEILSCTLGFHGPFLNCLQVLGIHSLPLFFLMTEAALMDEVNKTVLVPCSVSLLWQLRDQMCRGFFTFEKSMHITFGARFIKYVQQLSGQNQVIQELSQSQTDF